MSWGCRAVTGLLRHSFPDQNLRDRIEEARINGSTGEVEGLRTSLNAAADKLTSLDRMSTGTGAKHITALGIPQIGAPTQ
jgi:hypothetical protein